ncbi:hypothetical protein PTKIN_Ptkin02bG0024200 [Pterospermum kingtungense]
MLKKPRSQPLTSPIKASSTQRPFTEDDEITVLKGMLEYSEKKAAKGKKDEDKAFAKDHEQKAFNLSKMIWGDDGISGKVESLAMKAKENNRALSALEAELPSSLMKPTEVDKKSSKSLGSLFDKSFGEEVEEIADCRVGAVFAAK